MWWQWVIFALILVLIPLGLVSIKNFALKKITPTKEQETRANQRLFVLSLFYWLCDFFYMTFIINNLTWRFVLGGLIMVIVFYNLSKAFISGNKTFNFGLIQDFIVGIALTIYLIYIIPNEELQNIIIPIIAAVYGGLLTLVGVAWTIKKSDNDRKLEEQQKAKPIFTFVMKLQPLVNIDGEKVCFDNEEIIKFPNNVTALLENSEQAVFSVEKVYHDNKWWEIQGNKVVLPNSSVYLDFNFTEDVNKLYVEIKDRLGNLYYYQIKVLMLGFLTKHKGEKGDRVAHTIRELIEVSKEEINELI